MVLESLVKWNGEAHVDLTPGEYTQLTGRAGRRGIDVEGHGVVLWTPGFDPKHVAGLASTRTYPLRSRSGRRTTWPSTSSARWARAASRELLESSFAQFQADRAVVGLSRQVKRNHEALEGYREAMQCHLGDFVEYAALRRALKDRESQLAREGAAAATGQRRRSRSSSSSRRRHPRARRAAAGLAVVIDPHGGGPAGDPQPRRRDRGPAGQAADRRRLPDPGRVARPHPAAEGLQPTIAAGATGPGVVVAQPRPGQRAGGKPKRNRSAAADDAEIARLRAAIRRHPCHGCDEREQHARWAERHDRLSRDTAALEDEVASRTNTIARMFDRVCDLLDLARLSRRRRGDRRGPGAGADLLRVGSAHRRGAARGTVGRAGRRRSSPLSCSALVYEARRDDDPSPRLPPGRVRGAIDDLTRLWASLEQAEHDAPLDFLREPDLGFAWVAWRWAKGDPLDAVLLDTRRRRVTSCAG